MKWQTASISLMFLTLLLIAGAMVKTLYVPRTDFADLFTGNDNQNKLQFGYYDLISKDSELYNPHFVVSKDTIMLQLNSPDDNQLKVKVLMSFEKSTQEGLQFDYKPVFITQKDNDLMLANIMGHLERNHIIVKNLSYPDGKVTVTSSGQIISHF